MAIPPKTRFSLYPTPSIDQVVRQLQDFDQEIQAKFKTYDSMIEALQAKVKALGG